MFLSTNTKKALVFGSTGAIGSRIAQELNQENIVYVGDTREENNSLKPLNSKLSENLNPLFSSVVYAHGVNWADSVTDFQTSHFQNMIGVNVLSIASSVKNLLNTKQLNSGCSIVLLGSVWGSLSRTDKFSYTVSKSALLGLTRALAADLSKQRIRVNCINAGVVDSSMTRKNLTTDQISKLESETPLGLITINNICKLAKFLASEDSEGITGQSFVIDGGWSVIRNV
jgi:NAD(P)-dependent dehydrogenase (short-subunit alcohol dehydrogenase family)